MFLIGCCLDLDLPFYDVFDASAADGLDLAGVDVVVRVFVDEGVELVIADKEIEPIGLGIVIRVLGDVLVERLVLLEGGFFGAAGGEA